MVDMEVELLQSIDANLNLLVGYIQTMVDNWFPIAIGSILLISVVSLVKWLVKL